MHTVPLTPAPEGLFGGNLIAAFFFFFFLPPNICRRGIKQKVDLGSVEEFSSRRPSGGIVKTDSVYRSLGVTAFRNLHLLVPSSPW